MYILASDPSNDKNNIQPSHWPMKAIFLPQFTEHSTDTFQGTRRRESPSDMNGRPGTATGLSLLLSTTRHWLPRPGHSTWFSKRNKACRRVSLPVPHPSPVRTLIFSHKHINFKKKKRQNEEKRCWHGKQETKLFLWLTRPSSCEAQGSLLDISNEVRGLDTSKSEKYQLWHPKCDGNDYFDNCHKTTKCQGGRTIVVNLPLAGGENAKVSPG